MEEESLPQNQQRVRKERLERNKEARRKAVEKMLTARKKAAGTAPGISAQLAEREVQPRDRAGLAKALLNRRRATKASTISFHTFQNFTFFTFQSELPGCCCTFLVLLDKGVGMTRRLLGLRRAARSGAGPSPRTATTSAARRGWRYRPRPCLRAIGSERDRDLGEKVDEVAQTPEQEDDDDDLWSKRAHLHVSDDFLPAGLAERLRGSFDERFADPKQGGPERFAWDYWHVPDQYNLLRTPAKAYFSEEDYRELEDALLAYGQDKLGCSRMTPAWLSCYVDGCYQNFHADNPHGPWAFVLSLTRSADRFEGGATTIMKPSVLEYWRSYDSSKGCEFGDVFDTVAPQFNRLTVFDPRIPHGVSRVRGTQDPREGRLVLHGWYADPTPFFDGALDEDTVRRRERKRERECFAAIIIVAFVF